MAIASLRSTRVARCRFAVGLLAGLLLAAGLWGQRAGPDEIQIHSWSYSLPPLTIRAEVTSVPVEVVVRDADGLPVAGLGRERFRIFDNGKPRPLASFAVEAVTPASAAAPPGTAPQPPVLASGAPASSAAGPPRYLGLFFDDVGTDGKDLGNARNAAARFVREALGPGDRAAVFTASASQNIGFTADHGRLLAAIAAIRARPRASTHSEGCLRITDYQAYLIANHLDPSALDAAMANQGACDRTAGFQPDEEGMTTGARLPGATEDSEFVVATAYGIWQQNLATARSVLEGISQAVDVVGQQPGTRVLVLASGGMLAGTLEDLQDQIVQQALRAKVTINALDARGLYTEDPDIPLSEQSDLGIMSKAMYQFAVESQFSEGQEREAAMANLALSTGGLLFHNNNDLTLGFRRLGLAPAVTYALSFTPESLVHDGKFHPLKVEIVPADHDTVQARRGYFAPPPDNIADPLGATDAAMRGAAPATGLNATIRASQRTASDVVHFHLDLAGVPFQKVQGRERERLVFTVGRFDSAGHLLAGKQAEMDMALKGDAWRKLAQTGLDADLSLPASSGPQRLRCVVEEINTGKLYAKSVISN